MRPRTLEGKEPASPWLFFTFAAYIFLLMSDHTSYKFGTLAIHGGQEPDPTTGAVMPPIYQTSTYAQEAPGVLIVFEYARTQIPTRIALE